MAVTNIVRTLRQGQLVILDNSVPPQSLTVRLDDGQLSWVERTNTRVILDRGSLAAGHLRRGDDEPVSLSFTARWTQLIGKSADAADPLQLYEFLTFAAGIGVNSTSPGGERETLRLEFTIADPTGAAGEKVTFARVYRRSLTLTEGRDANHIAFTGDDFETAPTVTRL